LRHGQGILILKNGFKYEGEFKANKIDGEGTLWDKDARVIHRGTWKNDVKVKLIEKKLSIQN
jgi:hypothetical protein